MELNFDWKGFQNFFGQKDRTSITRGAAPGDPIVLVCDQSKIVSVYSENEDLHAYCGGPQDRIMIEYPHREFHIYEVGELDKTLTDLSKNSKNNHAYQEIEYLRDKLRPQVFSRTSPSHAESGGPLGALESRKRLEAPAFRDHFFFEALGSWWRKIFPNQYGVFIRCEGPEPREFLLLFKNGKLENYHEPDLSSLDHARSREPSEVIRYLKERYICPIQGVFVSAQEWKDWSNKPEPWKDVYQSIQSNRLKFFPSKFGMQFLIFVRAKLGF